ncbi:hypothetical protein ACFSUK_07945 [Sphingobium scionense]|uniref:Uncharacterized protein n=1 Tax=Sphingobium scionense TaxID=1404341 RepID=A0A7W6LS03_9SPHN|nr:hypothetical protein [Sphingobium scionense]MBB4149087.1 hypothetical protein [Sphingobium scionense]
MSSFFDMILAVVLARLPRPTEDWQVGDLAICIGTEHFAGDPADPKPEDMLRVKHVCTVGLFLHFDGKPDNKHWIAANFRKVKPDREPAADEEWVEQLQRFRRKEVA